MLDRFQMIDHSSMMIADSKPSICCSRFVHRDALILSPHHPSTTSNHLPFPSIQRHKADVINFRNAQHYLVITEVKINKNRIVITISSFSFWYNFSMHFHPFAALCIMPFVPFNFHNMACVHTILTPSFSQSITVSFIDKATLCVWYAVHTIRLR